MQVANPLDTADSKNLQRHDLGGPGPRLVGAFDIEDLEVPDRFIQEAWHDEIINSSFTGTKITARENALFAIRYKARKYYREFTSLPDSLRNIDLVIKRTHSLEPKGGCDQIHSKTDEE